MGDAMQKRTLINWLGLTGVVALLSYAAAVLFSPLAYPDYNWAAQAVSDLSAENAPSKQLWQQLAALFDVCSVLCVMAVCVFVSGKLNKPLRLGIYLFAAMQWVTAVGYAMFPLSGNEDVMTFQDIMHIVVTVAVVLLSIASLVLIAIGGFRRGTFRSLAVWALISLGMMMFGAIGTNALPAELFGLAERFSVFAAVIFNAVLGVYLFMGFRTKEDNT